MKWIPPPAVSDARRLREACAGRYGRDPSEVFIVHAPYRICPLGAHIDHQLGPVSAFAMEHAVRLACVINDHPGVVINSAGFDGEIGFRVDEPQARCGDWADYARGAAFVLNDESPLRRGVSFLIEGELAEAGLSSSAAVGLGYLLALARANGRSPEAETLIELDRRIENDFMGLANGILDPAAISLAESRTLTVIHCRDRRHEHIRQAVSFEFLAFYSGLREALTDSSRFNDRVAECLDAGVQLRRLAGIDAEERRPLGEIDPAVWRRYRDELPTLPRRRAEHFFTESARVLAGATAWQENDIARFGALMRESGQSSISSYETGSPELIHLLNCLNETAGVHGARFCGAGFRGCCVALVEPGQQKAIAEKTAECYLQAYPQYRDRIWALAAVPSQGLRLG